MKFNQKYIVYKMATNKLRLTCLKLLKTYSSYNTYFVPQKYFYCTSVSDSEKDSTKKKLGFAVFSEKQEELLKPKTESTPVVETFVSLLRNSAFIEMGDPVGKVVIGEIYHIVGNDLYIDFGWKFPTVCSAPPKRKELYVPGAKVKLLIKDLELTTKFLGSDECVTLNEADCVLLGLVSSRGSNKNIKSQENSRNSKEESSFIG